MIFLNSPFEGGQGDVNYDQTIEIINTNQILKIYDHGKN
jgi:hypothetical protein